MARWNFKIVAWKDHVIRPRVKGRGSIRVTKRGPGWEGEGDDQSVN